MAAKALDRTHTVLRCMPAAAPYVSGTGCPAAAPGLPELGTACLQTPPRPDRVLLPASRLPTLGSWLCSMPWAAVPKQGPMAGSAQEGDKLDCPLHLQAARLGNLDALHAIGQFHQSGELSGAGMPQNLGKAAGYFGRAASAGQGCLRSAAQVCESEPRVAMRRAALQRYREAHSDKARGAGRRRCGSSRPVCMTEVALCPNVEGRVPL